MFDTESFNNLSYDEKMDRLAQVAHFFTEEQLELLCTKWKLERDIEQSKDKLRQSKDAIRRLGKEVDCLKAQTALLERANNDDREAQLLWQMQQAH